VDYCYNPLNLVVIGIRYISHFWRMDPYFASHRVNCGCCETDSRQAGIVTKYAHGVFSFLDVFAMHASNALAKVGVLKR
jgi:hypothetical protein